MRRLQNAPHCLSCTRPNLLFSKENTTPGITKEPTFVLPTGQPCKCQAQVVYLNTVGAGLRFTDRQAPLEVASIEHLKTSGQEE